MSNEDNRGQEKFTVVNLSVCMDIQLVLRRLTGGPSLVWIKNNETRQYSCETYTAVFSQVNHFGYGVPWRSRVYAPLRIQVQQRGTSGARGIAGQNALLSYA